MRGAGRSVVVSVGVPRTRFHHLFLSVFFSIIFVSLAGASGYAQAPPAQPAPPTPRPVTGFVSPYEIMRTARTAGFHPLAPPLRDGSTYVLRATDFRGILMRVVLDARTGAIRDVSRIVPGPGRYGQLETGPQPYVGSPYYGGGPPYGLPGYDEPGPRPIGVPQPIARLPAPHPAALPPLPRPRPQILAARQPGNNATPPKASPQASAKSALKNGAILVGKPLATSNARPTVNSDAASVGSTARRQNTPVLVPLND